MDRTMALEVLSGPMDGLRVRLLDNGATTRIGRQVGNHMTLPFDMTISRWHASVKKEGKAYYLTDEKSVSGTWVKGSRIDKTEMKTGMVLLLGGTIVEIIDLPLTQSDITFEDNHFNNPLDIYDFSDALKHVWESLGKEEKYFGVTRIFQQPEFQRQKKLYTYRGIQQVCRFDPRKAISDWMEQCEIYPKYRFFHPDQRVTSPRLWRILDIASNWNTKKIDFLGFLQAVIEDKKSPAARVICEDPSFILFVENKFTRPEKTSKKDQKASKKTEADPLKEILTSALIQMETIISGFIEDAMTSGLSTGESLSQPSDLNIAKDWDITEQANLSNRLKRLENNLVGVLAGHRDSLRLFEKEIGNRIHQVIAHEDRKGLFPISTDTSVSTAVKRVLKEAELEGLADRIVRQTVKNKIIL